MSAAAASGPMNARAASAASSIVWKRPRCQQRRRLIERDSASSRPPRSYATAWYGFSAFPERETYLSPGCSDHSRSVPATATPAATAAARTVAAVSSSAGAASAGGGAVNTFSVNGEMFASWAEAFTPARNPAGGSATAGGGGPGGAGAAASAASEACGGGGRGGGGGGTAAAAGPE